MGILNDERLQNLKVYLVRNSTGAFLQRTNYAGHALWTDNIDKAYVWTNIKSARAKITHYVKRHVSEPIPDLIEVSAGVITLIDESSRIKRITETKLKHEQERQAYATKEELCKVNWKIEQRKDELAQAFRELNDLNIKMNDDLIS